MEILSNITWLPFYILAAVSIAFSLGMIFNPNLVRAGFMLIGAFCSIAGIYFLLAANFVAISQILIYAVGIVLVVVFAIMLCSLKQTANNFVSDEDSKGSGMKKIIAFFLCSGLFGLLTLVINSQNWESVRYASGAASHEASIPEISSQYTAQIGNQMMSVYLLPFELISVLLLVILVGVIILSKKKVD